MKKAKKERLNKTKEKIQNKIDDMFWSVYGNNTSTLSSICRQLSFAEGGICWFFMKVNDDKTIMTTDIKIILIFLVLYFIFDACQYLALAIYNKAIALLYEQQLHDGSLTTDASVKRPSWINSTANVCFIMKLICISLGSFLLIGKFIFQFFV